MHLAGVLALTGACKDESGPEDGATGTTGGEMVVETSTEGGGEDTTAAAETGEPTPTTGQPVGYCHGFQVAAEAPFLSLYVLGGEELADGVRWPLECASTGEWMFGLYPALGGWDPMADVVTLAVEVDVAGHNIGPAGHFFSDEVGYYIGCGEGHGEAFGVVPVVPPVAQADVAQLDGVQAEVRVTVLADGQELVDTATVTLSAPGEAQLAGCL